MTDSRSSGQPLNFEFETGEYGLSFDEEIFELNKATIPQLSAYNQETEKYRLDRLACAWGQASAAVTLMSDKYRSRWNGAIVSLHDHKGMLRIVWRDTQSRIMFEGVIVGAWQRLGEFWCSHDLPNN